MARRGHAKRVNMLFSGQGEIAFNTAVELYKKGTMRTKILIHNDVVKSENGNINRRGCGLSMALRLHARRMDNIF